jgi:hypothetical protein
MNKSTWFLSAILLALPLAVPAAHAQSVCNKLTDAEVAAAVGQPLQRSATDPCRFGKGFHNTFAIIMHTGQGPGFTQYAASSRQEFSDTKNVTGIGSEAIFFGGGNLAVHYKNDVIFIQMMVGKTPDEKLAYAKAVAQKLIGHM